MNDRKYKKENKKNLTCSKTKKKNTVENIVVARLQNKQNKKLDKQNITQEKEIIGNEI